MGFQTMKPALHRTAGSVLRVLRYAFHDWTREMSPAPRLITTVGFFMQGYAFWALWSHSLVWPLMWPRGPGLYVSIFFLYMVGYLVANVMLTSEFFRKTELEADLIAAQQIQRTLQPDHIQPVSGYQFESYYRAFRGVAGDYFDVIDLGGNRILLALADVSGKGMPAALLASNIQALVRSIAETEPDLPTLAGRINRHLSRYTPSDRFATALFIVLNSDSGELAFVNAGHNPAMVCGSGPTRYLEPTGLPVGLFPSVKYEAGAAILSPGDMLLVFTDGLPDSMGVERPENLLRDALTSDPGSSLANLKQLVDPELNEDDITILLVKRLEAVPGN